MRRGDGRRRPLNEPSSLFECHENQTVKPADPYEAVRMLGTPTGAKEGQKEGKEGAVSKIFCWRCCDTVP